MQHACRPGLAGIGDVDVAGGAHATEQLDTFDMVGDAINTPGIGWQHNAEKLLLIEREDLKQRHNLICACD